MWIESAAATLVLKTAAFVEIATEINTLIFISNVTLNHVKNKLKPKRWL